MRRLFARLIVAVLLAGPVSARAQVTSHLYSCSQGWCKVAVSQLAGYLLEEFLGAQAPVKHPNIVP